VLLSWTLYQGWKRKWYSRRVFFGLCFTVLLLYSVRTWTRNPDWDNQLSLFRAALDVCPRSGKVLYNYGAEMEMKGEEEIARDAYEKSMAISETYDGAVARLGKIWLKRGNLTKSLDYYKIITNRIPKIYNEFAYHDVGYILWKLGHITKAKAFLEFAASITPKGNRYEGILPLVPQLLFSRCLLSVQGMRKRTLAVF
jgi:tetratricopeptide (TPR) repeat protein